MRLRIHIGVLIPLLTACINPCAAQSFNHTSLDRVLQTFVDEQGRVNYSGLKANPADLNAYVDQLGRVSPASHPERFPQRADSLAYWINAYNAFVLKGVVDAYPVKSVRDIKLFSGFFSRIDFKAGGRTYTLNDIEHQILRKQFQDPRVHAAINCASIGCPRLSRTASRPEELDASLDDAIRFFIQEPRNVRIDRDGRGVYLSTVFKWFREDFLDWLTRAKGVRDPSLVDYLALYLPEDDREFLLSEPEVELRYIDYDWGLNDQNPR